jgi:hypothetical protein
MKQTVTQNEGQTISAPHTTHGLQLEQQFCLFEYTVYVNIYLAIFFVRVDVVEQEERLLRFVFGWKNTSCQLIYHIEFVLQQQDIKHKCTSLTFRTVQPIVVSIFITDWQSKLKILKL